MKRNSAFYITAKKILALIATALWASWIISNSLKGSDASNLQSGNITGIINSLLRSLGISGGVEMIIIRKIAHFIEYSILGALVCTDLICFGCCRVNICLRFLGVCMLFSVCDELLQLFQGGRSCSVRDMLLDSSGAAAGIFAVYLIFFLVKRSIESKKM